MAIDENNIRYINNGEPNNEVTFNRPTRDLLKETNDEFVVQRNESDDKYNAKDQNLADVPDKTAARDNLELGTSATKDSTSSSIAGTVAERDANNTFEVGAPTDSSHPVRLGDIKQSSDITVTVGAGADFETINEALTHLSNFYPEYKNTGVTATIELQAGFVMSEQVLVRGIDFGWVTITGVDAQTTIANASLTTDFTTSDYGFLSRPAFGVSKGGVLPRIGQLFIFDVAGAGDDKHGVMAVGAGSSAEVLGGCGVVNAGTFGIYAENGSTINARQADVSGAGRDGIRASGGSIVNAHQVDASGAGTRGIYADRASTINAHQADASGAGTRDISVDNFGMISATGANASTNGFFTFSGGIINARDATGDTNIAVNTLTPSGIIFK